MRRSSSRAAGRKGALAVETAFVLLAGFFLLVFGIFEYSRFAMLRNLMDEAAREGARLAIVNTSLMSTTNIQDAVDLRLGGMGQQLQGYNKYTNISVFHADSSGNNIGTDWNNAKFGEGVGVTISGNFQPLLPSLLFMSTTVPVSTTAVMNSEAN
jgi:Flp pilus assembly protein TadG